MTTPLLTAANSLMLALFDAGISPESTALYLDPADFERLLAQARAQNAPNTPFLLEPEDFRGSTIVSYRISGIKFCRRLRSAALKIEVE